MEAPRPSAAAAAALVTAPAPVPAVAPAPAAVGVPVGVDEIFAPVAALPATAALSSYVVPDSAAGGGGGGRGRGAAAGGGGGGAGSSSASSVVPTLYTARGKVKLGSSRTVEEAIVAMVAPGTPMPDVNRMITKVRKSAEDSKHSGAVSRGGAAVDPGGSTMVCTTCGNNNQGDFIVDHHSGDVICLGVEQRGCGCVIIAHKVHEGDWTRSFSEDEDKRQHGRPMDPLFSTSYNLRTSFGDGGAAKVLRKFQDKVEMDLSQMGKDERRTREGYKDQHKRAAFHLIQKVSTNLNLHHRVMEEARRNFAAFRDEREHVHQYETVVAACIIVAYSAVRRAGWETAKSVQRSTCPEHCSETPCKHVLYPFPCATCGKRFNAKRSLRFHKCRGKDGKK
eukprot:PLAT3333.4.p1 GENE.PLAT3333.4~~PLAT3333.4.p1  ORF type:complete len:404 (-),score=137.46 PLAT3333.4:938-2116(-)